ncbi:DMT family transporter [Desulfoluna sp.]|uniref:DMT family transporter n=1 Tax=Desulfoluna sp. TaxID=2045199 RepID=UPI00261655E1|nr:DMT family transporter [Desulfoluna sp.]
MTQPSNKLLGLSSVFASAICFYLATATLRWARLQGVTVDSANFVFGRFFLGFLMVGLLLLIKKRPPKPVNWHYLIGRTVANTMAVYCFFKAVDLTSVAEGNILNMTYPLFVALFSWFTLKDERDYTSVFVVLIAFAGVVMILAPDMVHTGFLTRFNLNSLWGLGSGISASVAIIYLNLSRRVHSTETTLFFMFTLGCVIILVLFGKRIEWPDGPGFLFIALCSILSVMGQIFITFGFRFVTAVEGSIISSSRILLAALLGPVIAAEPSLTLMGWVGAFFIFSGNIYLALAPKKKTA